MLSPPKTLKIFVNHIGSKVTETEFRTLIQDHLNFIEYLLFIPGKSKYALI